MTRGKPFHFIPISMQFLSLLNIPSPFPGADSLPVSLFSLATPIETLRALFYKQSSTTLNCVFAVQWLSCICFLLCDMVLKDLYYLTKWQTYPNPCSCFDQVNSGFDTIRNIWCCLMSLIKWAVFWQQVEEIGFNHTHLFFVSYSGPPRPSLWPMETMIIWLNSWPLEIQGWGRQHFFIDTQIINSTPNSSRQ